MAELSDSEKNKILDYARSRYMREGFYKTSMDTLASELQMSKKTIYKYFPSKEILVEEVVNNTITNVSIHADEILKSEKDAVTKVLEFMKLLRDIISRFSEHWLRDIRLHMPSLWIKIDSFRTKKMTASIAALIEQGKKEKLFLSYPNEVIVTIFVSAIRAIVNPDFLLHNKFSYDQAATICFEILFNGILTEKGKKLFYKSFLANQEK